MAHRFFENNSHFAQILPNVPKIPILAKKFLHCLLSFWPISYYSGFRNSRNHVIFNKMLTPLSRGIVARKISSAQLDGTLEAGRSG